MTRPPKDPLSSVLKLSEFEALARERLDPASYAYYAGGAADEVTLDENVSAFRTYHLRPRVLIDVSTVDTSTTFLGTPVPMPFGLAPNAFQALAHPEGECESAKAASGAGILQVVSTLSNRSLEEIAAAAPGPRWFQLYMHNHRPVTEALVRRAERAGYRAITLTVDLPVAGYRERELRHPVTVLPRYAFGNFTGDEIEGNDLLEVLNGVINGSLTWDDVEWLRRLTNLPIIVKGIMTPEDAALAAGHGAAAIVVSNHGGRQLDRVSASIDVLEECVAAAGGRSEVYLDGGVRRGTDVVTALALGARGVFIGRPYLFALAVAGEAGVRRAIELLAAEVNNALALVGARSVEEVTRRHLS